MQGINMVSAEILREYLGEMHRLGKKEVPFSSFDFSRRAYDIATKFSKYGNNHEIHCSIRTLCDVYCAAEDCLQSDLNVYSNWVYMERYVSETNIRNEGFLKLLIYAENANHLPVKLLSEYSKTWERYMIGIVISRLCTPRIRSKAQANFYARSAFQAHRLLAHRYLAKNDNRTHVIKRFAA